METLFQGIDFSYEDKYSQFIKAYSIILRTNILSDYFNKQLIINPLYRGNTDQEVLIKMFRPPVEWSWAKKM